jgi:hypothetical protein
VFLFPLFYIFRAFHVNISIQIGEEILVIEYKKQVKQRAQVIGMFYGQIMNESKESSDIQKVKLVSKKIKLI